MKKLFLLSISLALCACSAAKYNTFRFTPEKGASIAVLPLENYTESPMAGIKTSAMAAAVLGARGVRISDRFSGAQERALQDTELKRVMSELAAANTAYSLTGSVNEWKYKAGLDAEPTVSITLRLFDNRSGEQVWTAVVSRTGAAAESTGVLAQKLLDKALSELK